MSHESGIYNKARSDEFVMR